MNANRMNSKSVRYPDVFTILLCLVGVPFTSTWAEKVWQIDGAQIPFTVLGLVLGCVFTVIYLVSNRTRLRNKKH